VLGRLLKRWASHRRRLTPQLKVLIVDDEPAICSFVYRVLRGHGHTTEVAHGVSEALIKFITSGPFDLLLTDENMPQCRGHELAAALRRLDPDILVLYLTGYSDMLFDDKALLWEGEAYVDKPVSSQALAQAISCLLAERRSREDESHHPDRG